MIAHRCAAASRTLARHACAAFVCAFAVGCALPHDAVSDDAGRDDAIEGVDGALDVATDRAADEGPALDVPPCPTGQTLCDLTCVDLSTDIAHCGSCESDCASAPNTAARCVGGVCMPGSCIDGYSDCDGNAANGCETQGSCVYSSCAELPAGTPSGPRQLGSPSNPWTGYCDTLDDGGGWTLVLKADGTQPTFTYAAPIWTDTSTLHADSADLSHTEAKFAGFSSLPVTAVRIVMFDPTDAMTRSIVLNVSASSLRDLFATETYVATMAGRASWEALMASGSLQSNCNREGFNVQSVPAGMGSEVRIGILGNDQTDCSSPNSRIGVGGAGATGSACNPTNAGSITVGNEAGCTADHGDRTTSGFAFVFVR